ncbi:MAG: AAA family ATPase [Rhizobiaceae bacterium]|nr:AAA family ATPase [Rhizobiaceae bacterium]
MSNDFTEQNSRPVLVRAVCAIALRNTLKEHPPVFEGQPFALVVIIPSELQRDFEGAAEGPLKMVPELSDIDVATPEARYRKSPDFAEVKLALRASRRTLILVTEGTKLPSYVIAGADKVCRAVPIDARLLVQAVRNLFNRTLPLDMAQRMITYPLEDVVAAMRPDRGFDFVLQRLEEAWRPLETIEEAPFVEELSGYGLAADWAKDLAKDLMEWRAGQIGWSEIDAGILLSGPPGVGKTLFARSLAKSCKASFVASSLAQWQAMGHLGDTLKAMRSTFKMASEKAPCILLIDEFDSIGDRTKFTGDHIQYCTEVVAALLECLDGALRREGVIVVGACNHPERLDAALLRPGRLGTHITIGRPDRDARRGILATHLKGSLGDDEIGAVASECEGFSGADIAHLVKGARRRARRRGDEINVDDLLAELPPAILIEGALRDHISVHEAGHVAVGLTLNIGDLTGVVVKNAFRNILPVGGGAIFERTSRLPTADFFFDTIATQLSGLAAEYVFFGKHLEGSGGGVEGNDLQSAADLATVMVAQFGMGTTINHFAGVDAGDREKIRRTVPGVNRQVEAILTSQLKRAKEIVAARHNFIRELAALLTREGAIDGATVKALYDAVGESNDP